MPKICPVCDTTYPDANAFCPVDGTTLHVVDLEGGLIGSVVADRYLVTDLLGEGGMGKVYLARHVRLPQQAAIKVLRPEMVSDPAAVARFNREATNASRIDDENVARVYDFGEAENGAVYLAMEYVPGRTLKDLVDSEGPLAPARAADLVSQIARGLDAAHRLKIIHRDLKPDNVLVTATADGRERVKVLDFGIAKAFGAEGGAGLTKTGFVVGTPEFMSPEQLFGEQLDARSDVYALALVAYQCLTKTLPFDARTPEQAMTARLTGSPRPLREVHAEVDWPPALQELFDGALSRQVDKRPESAGAFAKRFSDAVRAWQRASGGAAAAVGAGGTRPIPIPASPAPSAKATPARGADAPSPAKRPASRLGPIIGGVVAVGAVVVFFALRAMQSPDAATALTSADTGAVAAAPASRSVPPSAVVAQDSQPAGASAASDSAPPAGAVVRPPAPPVPTEADIRRAADSIAAARAEREAASERAAAASAASVQARGELDSLSRVLSRGPAAAAAQSIGAALRDLVPRLRDPADRTRAYLRLIDASALSGDMRAACAALANARSSARPAQQAEIQRYAAQLGCEG